jgi:ribonuclease BN (tRNA processing enzyme)
MRRLALALALTSLSAAAAAQPCGVALTQLQLLGSGGADLADGRAAPSALLWVDGKARLLIDAGPGAALRFVQTGASIADLDAVLLSQLRAEHSADLPALLQLPVGAPRTRALPVFGPAGNRWMPSTLTWVRTLFDPTRGAWRHLGEVLSPMARTSYKLDVHDLRARVPRLGVRREGRDEAIPVWEHEALRVTALAQLDGQTPTVAWRIDSGGRHLVIAATAAPNDALQRFAEDADLLLLPHSVADATAQGKFAAQAKIKHLLLARRVRAVLGKEAETLALIRSHYSGTVDFGTDLACITP